MFDKFYVRTITRDDGKRFDFDGHEIYLADKNLLLVRPEIQSSEVEYTDVDGGEMIQQRLLTHTQDFNGVIFPRNTDYWDLYFNLSAFFRINHYYRIVYKRRDGNLFAQRGAWLTNNLQIALRPDENHSPFSVGFKFQTSLMYEFAEDDEGNEVFANTVTLPLIGDSPGGETWDSVGQVWDSVGSRWEAGEGGVQSVSIASVAPIYPVWTVKGESVNPALRNNTTDTVATYSGTVADGQTLVVDFAEGTARLNGSLVSGSISGEVIFRPGDNLAGFSHDGGTATNSTIAWDNIIGGGNG